MCEEPSDELERPPLLAVWPGILRRALVVVGCGVLTVTFAACESTESESLNIEREAAIAREHEPGALKIGAANPSVRVSGVTLLSGGGRNAVALRLSSSSARAQANLPVLVEVKGRQGKLLYTNQPGGTDPQLQHMGLLPAHASRWWVDDQILIVQPSTGVHVRVGTAAKAASRHAGASLQAKTMRVAERAGVSTLTGELVNRGGGPQRDVPVFAVALRGRRVVAAGRALVSRLAGRAGASARFQIPLIGDAANARIELTASPAGPTRGSR
jgi:hypothetical protein